MDQTRIWRKTLFGMAFSIAGASAAFAHHGWAWTEDGFFELEGTIVAMTFGNPHPTIDVDVDVEGETWRVDLATPAATARSGFAEDKAAIGDEIYAIGNRSRDSNERWMKAVRIIVNGETFDVYPSRVPTN